MYNYLLQSNKSPDMLLAAWLDKPGIIHHCATGREALGNFPIRKAKAITGTYLLF
jgi:hypothetical protein